jgi:DNA polymerase III sliding clamp (beta) subunit (PCNA family)
LRNQGKRRAYPSYKQVIPRESPSSVVIPQKRRPGVIKWLRTLRSSTDSVTLRVDRPGELTLTRIGSDGHAATLRVPVEVTGLPPTIAFHPPYLARALEIGGTIRLSDEMSPGLIEGNDGRFCVVMPLRATAAHRAEPNSAASHAAA